MTDYDLILQDFGLRDENVLAVFPYGSRVYGTATEQSDYDYAVVCRQVPAESDRLDSKYHPISLTIYSFEGFQERVENNRISVLECLFLPKEKVLKCVVDIPFRLNKFKLRESVSAKASNDWVQCKKRFSDDQGWNPTLNQPYVKRVYEAKKSLFHCLRIVDFGMQIATHNRIRDYSSCNGLWEEIYTEPSEDWEFYKEKYQKQYNAKMTEFRLLAPKELKGK